MTPSPSLDWASDHCTPPSLMMRSLVIFTLYWKKGDDLSTGNLYNIQAVLFMWVVLPAYNSASTMPTLVMERQLFTRCA